ncbi:MAG: hypothetical protein HFF68_01955, partial [Oscillospiraceae bacterium]|nr:hypothetical protein [Oscillospiraceae bacterium]
YVHTGEVLADTASLDDVQRRELAVWLKSTYLNTLLQGRAVFRETEKGSG